MWQCALRETVSNTLALHVLLPHTGDNLGDVELRSLRAGHHSAFNGVTVYRQRRERGRQRGEREGEGREEKRVGIR